MTVGYPVSAAFRRDLADRTPVVEDIDMRRYLVALGSAVLLAGVVAVAVPAAAAVSGPVIDQNFPDPDVMKVGATYYAYATNGDGRHIKWATSTDLVGWSVQGSDALPALGAWVDVAWSNDHHGVWAPEVFSSGPNSFVMWYVAHDAASGRQCIGAATASTPGGPFAPRATALVCTPATGGSIDASSFLDNGVRYIVWKNDGNCCGQDTWIHIQQVSADGLSRIGAEHQLIKQTLGFEGNLVEAPTLWKRGGVYVLFYSANSYAGTSYVSSYARATDIFGPYTKAVDPLMTTETFGGTVRGPGGQDVVTGPGGSDRIVFHGWNPSFTYRAMYSQALGWANDYPVVRGSKVRYQAENAALTHVVVRSAAGASDGRAVGHIDYDDSRVAFTVYAPRSGSYQLYTRFGNGSAGGAATHRLWVNGVDAGTVSYPVTGWDNWQTVERGVTLCEGWNTITYGKGSNFTELDMIEVA
jgi:arabinan endo-1,5-alpha-L-arabinosidase